MSDPQPLSPQARAERNLLFALLAIQLDVASCDQIVRAASVWVKDKSQSLDGILVEQGVLDADTRGALLLLAAKRWPGSPDPAAEQDLHEKLKELEDPEIDQSIMKLGKPTDHGNQDVTLPIRPGGAERPVRFRKLKSHAKGGLGEVFLALDDELDRRVALKEMLARVADQRLFRERFLFEAIITGRLEHPGIVPVYGLGKHQDGRPFYAMRLIRGESLQQAIEDFHRANQTAPDRIERPLQLRGLLRRFVDVCNAIHFAHAKGVLHRDIKPANIMLGRHGETLVVDWGLAKHIGRPSAEEVREEAESLALREQDEHVSRTEMGSIYGTPEYMPPEQAQGRMDLLQPCSDVYSLGVTLYFLLTGQPPFTSNHPDREKRVEEVLAKVIGQPPAEPRTIDPNAPAALAAICLKAMSKSQDERHPTARALADDVERWLADEPIAQIRATVDYFAKEHAASPQVVEYAERLARELYSLSTVLSAMGRHPEALDAVNRAAATLDGARTDTPRQRLWLAQERFYVRQQQIRELRRLGRLDEAEAIRVQEESDFEELYRQAGSSREMMQDLMSMTLHRGWSIEKAIERFQASATSDEAPPESARQGDAEDDDGLGTLHQEEQPPATGGGEPDPLETAHNEGDPGKGSWPREAPMLGDGQDFEIRGVIARGGSATLYRAWDRRLHRAVAIKVIRSDLMSSRWIIENEAKFLGQLLHPHIVPVLSAGCTSNGSAYLTMPLYDDDLWQLIRRRDQPLDLLLRQLSAICNALDYVHRRGVIHGDPKPSNIVAKGEHAALIDWGLAMHRANFTADDPIVDWHGVRLEDGQIYGTPAYMSPEQLRGDPHVTPATDVYVLGGTLYTILTGQAPYSGVGNMSEFLRSRLKEDVKPQPVRQLQPRAPKELVRICDQALASSPDDRFPSAAAMGDAIDRWLNRSWWRKGVRRFFWTTSGKGP